MKAASLAVLFSAYWLPSNGPGLKPPVLLPSTTWPGRWLTSPK